MIVKMKPRIVLQMAILCGIIFLLSVVQSEKIVGRFEGTMLKTLKKDASSGHLYIGGTNHIYELATNLSIIATRKTGPRNDSINCPPNPSKRCTESRTPHNNTNILLVIDSENKKVIACSTLYYGFCEKYSTDGLNKPQSFYVQVVTNSELSAVGMIADGFDVDKIFYVGSSPSVLGHHTEVGAEQIPMLASRNLNTLEIASRDITAASFKDYFAEYHKTGYVIFKDMFHHKDYIYYLTVQRERSGNPPGTPSFKSYLVRTCKYDKKYQSYIQIPLGCDAWPDSYNIAQALYIAKPGKKLAETGGLSEDEEALFISFSKSFQGSSEVNLDSALCVYSFQNIKLKFAHNLADCFKGNGYLGPEFLKKDRESCRDSGLTVGESYCGEHDLNHPIDGSTAANAELATKMKTTIVNSLLVKTTGNATIALMGTSKGDLLKMVVESPTGSEVYHSMALASGHAIKHDMEFDNKKDHIYVLTSTEVLKVQLADCGIYENCDSCLSAGDPHCGWCFKYNKCMTERECPKDTQYENYVPWLSYKSICPAISNIQPNPIGYDAIQNITLKVEVNKLPNVKDGKLSCELHAHIFIKNKRASWVKKGDRVEITCQPFQDLQALPENESNLTAQLSVKLDQVVWASKSLVVYDCSARGDSCHSCTSTDFPCTWCVSDNKCISSNQDCSDMSRIHSVRPPGPSRLPLFSKVGSEFCPRIQLLDDNTLITHSGVNQTFSVRALKLTDGISSLKCQFSLFGKTQKVRAELVKDTIKCDQVGLEYRENIPFQKAGFAILWGAQEFHLDNPDNVTVKVYKCSKMEDHCGKCLVMDPRHGCGWCHRRLRSSCSLKTECDIVWLNYTQDCPNVQIEGIQPTSGPVRGGTNITITGKNMGKLKTDLVKVAVASVACNIVEYEPSTRFVCVTGPAKNASGGPVYLDVRGKYNCTSDLQYTYVDPVIKDFNPKKGPKAGGTNVTLSGMALDAGNVASVSIEGVPCVVHGRNGSALWFTTGKQDHPMKANIKLKVDNSQEISAVMKFSYGEDPIINTIRPDRAIISGGNILDVEGVDLNVVQNPKFFVRDGSNIIMTNCLPTAAAAFMNCPSPDISHLNLDLSKPVLMPYGFVMDGVTKLLNISEEGGFPPLTYFPDPIVFPFKKVKYVKGNPLTIEGRHMIRLRVFTDITIKVGGTACTKEEVINDERIICIPPTPDMVQTLKDGNAEVTFVLGNFNTSLGYMQYKSTPGLPLAAVIGIVIGAAVLIGLAIVLFIILKRRKKKKKKEPPVKSFIYKPKTARPNQYEGAEGGELAEVVPLRSDTDRPACSQQPDEETYLSSVLSSIENEALRKKVQEVLISRKRVEVKEELGKGHFGQVFLANLLDEYLDHPREVAVKTLQGTDLDQKQIESFLREGVIMKRFRHLHIMSLLGVCIGPNQQPMVILPYMANGDLRNYVKDKKKNFTARQLLQLAQQVAEGMAYLASLNFVHRDLAARNCMIDDTNTVKVADFGLTREIYEREYYSQKDKKAKLPIKWMALESLEDYVFTIKSDVWSFGVLMWELMTRGVTPYPDVDAFDLRTYLASGRRLRKPKYCPDNVYKIMLDCWDEIPERRSNFANLVNRLEILLNPPKKRTSSKEEGEPIYQNLNKAESSDYLNPVSAEGDED